MKLLTRSDAPDAKLGIVERSAYMAGNIGTALINTVVASFIMFYYTDVMLLNPGVVGMILLASRLFDGVTDLIMGVIVDHTHSRFGKGRVWLIRMCLPYAVSAILMLSVPAGSAGLVQYLYVILTYNLCNSICMTAIYVPYNSMTVTLTSDPYERGILGIFVMFGAIIGTMAVQSTIDAMTKALGGGPDAWRNAAVIYALCGMLLHLLCFFGTKERSINAAGQQKKIPIREEIKSVLTNKYWLLAVGATFCILFFTCMVGGSGMYFAKGILGDTAHYATLANSLSVAQLAGMFLAFLPMKKLGKRNTMLIGVGIVAVASLTQYLLGVDMAMIVVCNVCKGVGAAFASAVLYGMVADTIDYGEWKSGIAAAGIGASAMTFVTKVAGGLSNALIGYLMDWSGYDATLAVQPDKAVFAINLCYTLIPVACGLLAILLLAFYKLDKSLPHIQKELAERRKGAEHEA